ncbi:butyrophilin-like protein 3 [Castor canadensis]|uniref:Butyrophilin-like protein 3 n=1 Tax=Castor canadensis TaxID=51338 RepID=A0AC58L8N2_CASCN
MFPPTGQWKVIGPNKSIRVLAGETATFSCFLSPETSAEAMEVRFFKDQLYAVVHLYRDRKDQENMKMPQYQRRTEFVRDSLDKGRAILRLEKVTPSDAGLYGCWFSSQSQEEEAFWELEVTELGSTPLISVMEYVDGGIQLLCQTSGWFPEPIVRWKGPEGPNLPLDTKVKEDMHGRFDVETSLTVQDNSGSVSCSVQLPDQSQEVESRVWVGGKMQTDLEKVTLDPDSAHPHIYTSDLKVESSMTIAQEVAFSEKRFRRTCVVASEGFQNGKHYWEVDVGFNKRWYLGVCRDDVDRKGTNVKLSSNSGYWVLGLWTAQQYFTVGVNRESVSVKTPPSRVGVFLDYEGGSISFFNINDQSLISTLKHQFEGLLRPYIQFQIHGEDLLNPISFCPVPPK